MQYRGAVVLPAFIGSNDGSSLGGVGNLRPPPPEHHFPVHLDFSNNLAVYGGVSATGRSGITGMMGSGVFRIGWLEVSREGSIGGGGGAEGRGKMGNNMG